MIRQHFQNILHFRNSTGEGEKFAILELRKRISWYARTMAPCRMLKDPMREFSSTAEFESIIDNFLDWRKRYDEDVAAGRIRPIPKEELVEAA
jgi:hypothetical protein